MNEQVFQKTEQIVTNVYHYTYVIILIVTYI